jgi:hypothetical protein
MTDAQELLAIFTDIASGAKKNAHTGAVNVYFVTRAISRTGMRGTYGAFIADADGDLRDVTYHMAKISGFHFDAKLRGIRVGGCGFSRTYEIASRCADKVGIKFKDELI